MAKVLMYVKNDCPYCTKVKNILASRGIEIEVISIDDHPEKGSEMVKRTKGRRTVPQMFVGDRHVGGREELFAAQDEDRLDVYLKEQGLIV